MGERETQSIRCVRERRCVCVCVRKTSAFEGESVHVLCTREKNRVCV